MHWAGACQRVADKRRKSADKRFGRPGQE